MELIRGLGRGGGRPSPRMGVRNPLVHMDGRSKSAGVQIRCYSAVVVLGLLVVKRFSASMFSFLHFTTLIGDNLVGFVGQKRLILSINAGKLKPPTR